MRSILLRPASSLIALIVVLAGAAIVFASDGMTASQATPITVTGPDGVCKKITNNNATGLSEYIPTATVSEWQSFYMNPPAGVTLSSCVTAGSQTYSTPGTYTFTVPAYNTLTVEVWGAGGGGGGTNLSSGFVSGASGGASSWNGNIIANGGGGGSSVGGAGGSASGGTTNTTGTAGQTWPGGSSAVGGVGGAGANGGAGGAGSSGGVRPNCLSAPGGNGGSPGGGGGGGSCRNFSTHAIAGGGGGGGYASRAYADSNASFAAGAQIAIVVGSGGTSSQLNSGSPGGTGAAGQVKITWN